MQPNPVATPTETTRNTRDAARRPGDVPVAFSWPRGTHMVPDRVARRVTASYGRLRGKVASPSKCTHSLMTIPWQVDAVTL